MRTYLFGDSFASPIDAVIRRLVAIRLGNKDLQVGATVGIERKLLRYDPVHLAEMNRVPPHSMNEDKQVSRHLSYVRDRILGKTGSSTEELR